MQVNTIAVPLLVLLAVFTEKACADAKQDAEQLDKIIAQIEQLLPAGWTVTFEVEKGFSRPKLVISSTDELPVEYMGPGKSADPDIDTTQKKVTIDITFVPYMAPADRAKAHKRNEELEQQRRRYEESRLKQQQSRYKGDFTPSTYQWQTGDRSPIIREYALFWLNTEPQSLPSHHSGRFSIFTFDLDPLTNPLKIHDQRRAKEFARIVEGLTRIFVPYDSER